MNALTIAAIVDQEVAAQIQTQTPEGCINNNEPKMDGTGAHLGLRDPWYNSGIHALTDTTWFRWAMVFVVVHYIYTTWLK